MQNQLDIGIEGASVFVGEEQPVALNIGISGDEIVSISRDRLAARRVIRGEGLFVAPGFIDLHNHSDVQLQKLAGDGPPFGSLDPLIRCNHNYITQGVTTIVTGNCGEGITEIQDWENFYKNSGFGTNVCHLVPYGSLRRKISGENKHAYTLSVKEIEQFKKMVDEEMGKGAAGLSTAFDTYPLCRVALDEIIDICKVVAQHSGIYITHIRNESGKGILAAIQEAIKVAEESDIAVHLSQLRIYPPVENESADNILELLLKARQRGIRISASQNPYVTIAASCGDYLISHLLSNICAADSDVLLFEASIHDRLRALLDIFAPERIRVVHNPTQKQWEGATLAEIGKRENKEPGSVLFDLYRQEAHPYLVIDVGREEDITRLMLPEFVYTSSNGEVALPGKKDLHPRSYGTFPRKIHKYAIKEKIISMASAINSMTMRPAELLRLRKRGRVEIGNYADLVIFDAENVADRLDYQYPDQYCTGIEYVIVNGRIALEHGSLVPDNVNGRLLRTCH